MRHKLELLNDYLYKSGFLNEASRMNRIVKICAMLGIDYPAEETDVDGIDDVLDYLGENPGKFIFLDNPKGSKKRFGQKTYKEMPFHYGEFVEINNPADDMGWDVILVPSAQVEQEASQGEVDHVPAGHNFIPIGYVPVNDSQEEWTARTKSPSRPEGKPAPVGNDKIILAPDGIVTDEDKRAVEEFFGPMWNFKDVIWL